jgi:hypothetical protein
MWRCLLLDSCLPREAAGYAMVAWKIKCENTYLQNEIPMCSSSDHMGAHGNVMGRKGCMSNEGESMQRPIPRLERVSQGAREALSSVGSKIWVYIMLWYAMHDMLWT